MATELLERTAIQMFRDDGAIFEVPEENTVRITIPMEEAGMVNFQIVDYGSGLLTIKVGDFVRFLPDQEKYASEMCDRLNERTFGKFFIDEYCDMSYELDYPAAEATGATEFRAAFAVALSIFQRYYPIVMSVRWANCTIEQALERREIGQPGERIISDEQFQRFMDNLRSGNEDEGKD